MLKKYLQGYKSILGSTWKIFILLIFCVLLGLAIVFPLWEFATNLPGIYTLSVTSILCLGLIFFIVKKIRENSFKSVLRFFFRILISVFGIISIFALVLNGKRIIAIPVFIAMILLYGFTALPQKKNFTDDDSEHKEKI